MFSSLRMRQCGLYSVRSTTQAQETVWFIRKTYGWGVGDLGSTPIPVIHPCSDASWSLPSLDLCFPICTMGTWQCLGLLYLLMPSQGDRSVNSHVTEHSQVAHVGDQPVTSRHCWISQGHRLPRHLALLGIERTVR